MTKLANVSMILIATGCAAIVQSFWTPIPWPVVVLVFPATIGLGFLCIRYRANRYRRIAEAWNEYVPAARACAEDVKNGRFTGRMPPRPNLVSDLLTQITTPEPLEPYQADTILMDRVPRAVATLLAPCGEVNTFLGRSDAVVCERGSQAELLQNAWVIDREWEDGRWTTEWVHVSVVGSRLRVAVGGEAYGPRKARDKQLRHQEKFLLYLGTPVFFGGAMLFPMLGMLTWMTTMTCFALAIAIHELASVAYPLPMKASLNALNRHCVPSLAFKFVAPLYGDTSALKLRLAETFSSLNLPSR